MASWYTLTICTVLCSATLDNASIEETDDIKLINAAHYKFCQQYADCHFSLTLHEDINKLQHLMTGQFAHSFRYPCELCQCSEICCCNNEQEDVQEDANTIMRCVQPQMKKRTPYDNAFPVSEFSYLFVTSCQASYQNVSMKKKCMNENFNNGKLISPVFYIKTKLSYMNKYCVECNTNESISEDDLLYWDKGIECSRRTAQFSFTTGLQDVLNQQNCNMLFYPGHKVESPQCKTLIDSCNITGEWELFNDQIWRLCGLYTATYKDISKNVFCYICNTATDGKSGYNIVPLRMLLTQNSAFTLPKAPEQKPGSNEQCPWNSAFDSLQGKCVQAMCISPKMFINGKCVSSVELIGGVWYRLFVVLSPKTRIENVNYSTNVTLKYFSQWLYAIQFYDALTSLSIHYLNETNNNGTSIKIIVVHLEVQVAENFHLLINATSVDKLLQINDFDCSFCESETSAIADNFSFHYDHFVMEPVNVWGGIEIYLLQIDGVLMLTSVYEKITRHKFRVSNHESPFNLYSTFICPLINLNVTYYNISLFY